MDVEAGFCNPLLKKYKMTLLEVWNICIKMCLSHLQLRPLGLILAERLTLTSQLM
jgi:hypothetical protein